MNRRSSFFCCGTFVVLCLQLSHAQQPTLDQTLSKPKTGGAKTR